MVVRREDEETIEAVKRGNRRKSTGDRFTATNPEPWPNAGLAPLTGRMCAVPPAVTR